MALLAMLDVFSGKPNPVWPIADDQAQQMMQLVGTSEASADSGAGLGYRGFRIIETDTDPGIATSSTADAVGSFTVKAMITDNADAEKGLLDAGLAAGAINQDLYGYVANLCGQALGGPIVAGAGGGSCPPCGGGNAPSYNPAFWNDPSRQPFNNCYNYANDNATNTFAQPGRGSGSIFGSLVCDDVRIAAERDGLTTTNTYQASQPGWYVALVIWPGQDYHWYRQDDVGCWSHKPGQTQARNIDNSGQPIADPQQCNRGPYTAFCTFMVTRSGVTIS